MVEARIIGVAKKAVRGKPNRLILAPVVMNNQTCDYR
jgi:hypothetical protein